MGGTQSASTLRYPQPTLPSLSLGSTSSEQNTLFSCCIGKDVVAQSGVFTTSGAWAGRDGGNVEHRGHRGTGELICDASARVHRAQDTVPTCEDRGHRCIHSPTREMASHEGMGWRGGDSEGHARDARAFEGPQLSAALCVCRWARCGRTNDVQNLAYPTSLSQI